MNEKLEKLNRWKTIAEKKSDYYYALGEAIGS